MTREKIKYYSLWFLLINIIVFFLQVSIQEFTELGVLNQTALNGEYWRFVTAIFLHGSATHLIYNMFALFFFGFSLEKLIGSRKFLLVFFGSGIIANLISVNFYESSLGASGAIMGIIGTLAILRPLMAVWVFGMVLPMSIAAIIYVIVDAVGIFIPSNIGHIAHLSGIFFGIVFGIIFRINMEKQKKNHKVKVPEHLLRRWETLYMNAD